MRGRRLPSGVGGPFALTRPSATLSHRVGEGFRAGLETSRPGTYTGSFELEHVIWPEECMSESLAIQPVTKPIKGKIRPPGSKSLTNRALIVAALAAGKSRLTGVLDSQDTRVMIDSLKRLGLTVTQDVEQCVIEIVGCGGRPGNVHTAGADQSAKWTELWLENSGTSIRFLTALCTLGHGQFRLDGNARMRERPIGELASALNQLGADVRCETGNDCPPVIVSAAGLSGGKTTVDGQISSQYLSALLMAAPCAANAVTIQIAGTLVSEPYVEMTLQVMRSFGVTSERAADGSYIIAPQQYGGTEYDIEPDASAASYFFAAAAVTGGCVTVEGLSRNSLQGDIGFVEALRQMGCDVSYGPHSTTVLGPDPGTSLRGIDIDMNAISDTAQTLAAVAPFASGPTRIRNIAHVRHKETDRIAAVATELRLMGQLVEEHDDGLTIHPAPVRPAVVQTYDDHRMAMSFAVAGLRATGIRIADPGCTRKTYPRFFEDLHKLCGLGPT